MLENNTQISAAWSSIPIYSTPGALLKIAGLLCIYFYFAIGKSLEDDREQFFEVILSRSKGWLSFSKGIE